VRDVVSTTRVNDRLSLWRARKSFAAIPHNFEKRCNAALGPTY
jgi:hypothetical protein